MEINFEKWNAGWLQWGANLKAITPDAQEDLKQLKLKHPDWDFRQLQTDVENGTLKPR